MAKRVFSHNGMNTRRALNKALDTIDAALSGVQAAKVLVREATAAFPNAILDGQVTVNSSPGRSLDSTFQPSATRPVLVCYVIEFTTAATVAGGQTGTVELRSDAASPPTTVRGSVLDTLGVTLGISVNINHSSRVPLVYIVPAGHNVRLVSSGTATISLASQTEITL